MAAAAGIALAAGTAGVTAAVVGAAPPSAGQSATASPGTVALAFSAQAPGPITAVGSLVPLPWGTGISWECSYAPGAADYEQPGGSAYYVLVVVARDGAESTVASWSASPGSTVSPTATTSLPVSAIAHVDIRRSADSSTLLRATP
ncbi:hypothetical protein ACQCSX_04625 [Pseudarthrobacter sp. P1]|uniref:hypothetical protein n=1 Tax=Pseudarthrobacter sp. P1 TaxID=3418418 RepID=UPI003CEF0B13